MSFTTFVGTTNGCILVTASINIFNTGLSSKIDIHTRLLLTSSSYFLRFFALLNASVLEQPLTALASIIERNIKLKAKKPDYISIKEGETKAYLENVSIGLDMEEKEVFMNQMRQESEKLNIKGDMNKFMDMFASNMSDIIDKDNSFDKSFRVWGPENRFQNRDCSGNPEGKGPCRMFNCLCRDSEENDGEILYDWFTGKCDHCNRQISDRSYAVRYPHKDGGWKGCYCCFYCVSQLPPYQTNKEDNVRMKHIETRIKEIGIMDRSLL